MWSWQQNFPGACLLLNQKRAVSQHHLSLKQGGLDSLFTSIYGPIVFLGRETLWHVCFSPSNCPVSELGFSYIYISNIKKCELPALNSNLKHHLSSASLPMLCWLLDFMLVFWAHLLHVILTSIVIPSTRRIVNSHVYLCSKTLLEAAEGHTACWKNQWNNTTDRS